MAEIPKWKEWSNYTRRTRANFEYLASQGNEYAKHEMREAASSIRAAANYRLQKLEEYGLDYGGVYNNATNYTNITFGTKRFGTLKELGYDYSKLFEQTEVALKFLNSEMSKWQKALEQRNYRIEALEKNKVLPQEFSRVDEEEFLRFLGNEEVSAVIEEYGSSDIIVDMIYEEYKKNGSDKFRIIQIALNEYLDKHNTTFTEAMHDIGIPIEDYIRRNAERKGLYS